MSYQTVCIHGLLTAPIAEAFELIVRAQYNDPDFEKVGIVPIPPFLKGILEMVKYLGGVEFVDKPKHLPIQADAEHFQRASAFLIMAEYAANLNQKDMIVYWDPFSFQFSPLFSYSVPDIEKARVNNVRARAYSLAREFAINGLSSSYEIYFRLTPEQITNHLEIVSKVKISEERRESISRYVQIMEEKLKSYMDRPDLLVVNHVESDVPEISRKLRKVLLDVSAKVQP